jgi:hypothetical protein
MECNSARAALRCTALLLALVLVLSVSGCSDSDTASTTVSSTAIGGPGRLMAEAGTSVRVAVPSGVVVRVPMFLLPEGAARASHWVGTISPELRDDGEVLVSGEVEGGTQREAVGYSWSEVDVAIPASVEGHARVCVEPDGTGWCFDVAITPSR